MKFDLVIVTLIINKKIADIYFITKITVNKRVIGMFLFSYQQSYDNTNKIRSILLARIEMNEIIILYAIYPLFLKYFIY